MRKFITVSGGAGEISGWVEADTDLDGVFHMTDEETGERYRVCGWNCDITHD